jgi:phospholipid/cholesterol/gamma-HCH transport system permease protein
MYLEREIRKTGFLFLFLRTICLTEKDFFLIPVFMGGLRLLPDVILSVHFIFHRNSVYLHTLADDFYNKIFEKNMNIFLDTGKYVLLMKRVLVSPDRWKMFFRQFPKELEKLGLQSLPIVIIISVFIGAIMTIQTKLNTENPMLPTYSTGLVTRDTLLLEFSSTILCLILAGKIGSNIASEIGTMRITEQIDALEIMGVNSANYLILPKITAFVFMMPFLVIFSMGIGLFGGYLVGVFSDIITTADYLVGIQYAFIPYYVTYSLVKSLVFAFIISSVAAYYGYYAYGGALDVGKASTNAVVNSSILILFFNLLITNVMLN